MKRYLFKIASRARGIPGDQANNITPVIRQWSAPETAGNTNPFEQTGPPENPVQHTASPRTAPKTPGKIPGPEPHLKHTPGDHGAAPSNPAEPLTVRISPASPFLPPLAETLNTAAPPVEEKQEGETGAPIKYGLEEIAVPPKPGPAAPVNIQPGALETAEHEPLSPASIQPGAVKTVKPGTPSPVNIEPGTAETVNPPDIKEGIIPGGININVNSNISSNVNSDLNPDLNPDLKPDLKPNINKSTRRNTAPVSSTANFNHANFDQPHVLAQSPGDNKTPEREPLVPGTSIPVEKTAQQRATVPRDETRDKPVTRRTDAPVSELRPASPGSAAQVIPLKKENTGPKLVIGRLNVEVVTPPPVNPRPAVIPKAAPAKTSRSAGPAVNVSTKMRFGLGQI